MPNWVNRHFHTHQLLRTKHRRVKFRSQSSCLKWEIQNKKFCYWGLCVNDVSHFYLTLNFSKVSAIHVLKCKKFHHNFLGRPNLFKQPKMNFFANCYALTTLFIFSPFSEQIKTPNYQLVCFLRDRCFKRIIHGSFLYLLINMSTVRSVEWCGPSPESGYYFYFQIIDLEYVFLENFH